MAPIMSHITIPSVPVIMVRVLLPAGGWGLLAGDPGLGDAGVRGDLCPCPAAMSAGCVAGHLPGRLGAAGARAAEVLDDEGGVVPDPADQ
jgi:hypothetical protein